MSSTIRQGLLIASLSITFVVGVVVIARRRLLSFRYTVGWLVLGTVGLLAALLTPLVQPVAGALGITPTAFFALGGSGILLLIAVQLSISVSGLQRQVHQLAEAHALLAEQLTDRTADAGER